MVDGTQDVCWKKQEAVCLRYADKDLFPPEEFWGLYSLILNLPFNRLFGQAYDGLQIWPANTMEPRTPKKVSTLNCYLVHRCKLKSGFLIYIYNYPKHNGSSCTSHLSWGHDHSILAQTHWFCWSLASCDCCPTMWCVSLSVLKHVP